MGTVKERINQLKEEWKATKDEDARKAITEQLQALYDEHQSAFPVQFYIH